MSRVGPVLLVVVAAVGVKQGAQAQEAPSCPPDGRVSPSTPPEAVQDCIDRGGTVLFEPGDYYMDYDDPMLGEGWIFMVGRSGHSVEIAGQPPGERPRLHATFRYGCWGAGCEMPWHGFISQPMDRLVIRDLEQVDGGVSCDGFWPKYTLVDNLKVTTTGWAFPVFMRSLPSPLYDSPVSPEMKITNNELFTTAAGVGSIGVGNFWQDRERTPRVVISGNFVSVEGDPDTYNGNGICTHGNLSGASITDNTIVGSSRWAGAFEIWDSWAYCSSPSADPACQALGTDPGASGWVPEVTRGMTVEGNDTREFTGQRHYNSGTCVTGSSFGSQARPNLVGHLRPDWTESVAAFEEWGNGNSIVGNDFRDSGIAGKKQSGQACILLADTSHDDFVSQAGTFPAGTGGAKHQVVNLGTNNRIIGVAAAGPNAVDWLVKAPASMTLAGDGPAALDVVFGFNGTYEPRPAGLVRAGEDGGTVSAPDDARATISAPAGVAHLRVRLDVANPDMPCDLDLEVYDSDRRLVGGSYSGGALEQVDVAAPVEGTYFVRIIPYWTPGGLTAYKLWSWLVPQGAGSLTAAGGWRAVALSSGTVTVDWPDGLDTGDYVGVIDHVAIKAHGAPQMGARTVVEVIRP